MANHLSKGTFVCILQFTAYICHNRVYSFIKVARVIPQIPQLHHLHTLAAGSHSLMQEEPGPCDDFIGQDVFFVNNSIRYTCLGYVSCPLCGI